MLWILALCLLALCLLLCVPLLLTFEIQSEPDWEGYVQLSWAGLLSKRRHIESARNSSR